MAARNLTFVDTNVLVYAHDRAETRKQPPAQALLEGLWASRTDTLSTQILQEVYVVAPRKFDPPMRRRAAREIVALYAAWPLVHVDLALIVVASELEARHKLCCGQSIVGAGQRFED